MPKLTVKDFQGGTPLPVVFTQTEPKEAKSNFGQEYSFGTTDGVLYLKPMPAKQLHDALRMLSVQPGERVLVSYAADTFNVRRELLPGAPVFSNGHSANANGHVNPYRDGGGGFPAPGSANAPAPMSQRMMACFMAALDAISEAQGYATRKGIGITFTSDNVTSAALSCYIQNCKEGR